jgi:hypothetical protein
MILEKNKQASLYFKLNNGRVFFLPQNWAHDFPDIDGDEEDGQSVYGYLGNEDVNRWLGRDTREWYTTDVCFWVCLSDLDQEISEEEARQLDPDLFRLLDAIDSKEAV